MLYCLTYCIVMMFVHHCKRGPDRIETGLVHVVFPFNAQKGKQRVAKLAQ